MATAAESFESAVRGWCADAGRTHGGVVAVQSVEDSKQSVVLSVRGGGDVEEEGDGEIRLAAAAAGFVCESTGEGLEDAFFDDNVTEPLKDVGTVQEALTLVVDTWCELSGQGEGGSDDDGDGSGGNGEEEYVAASDEEPLKIEGGSDDEDEDEDEEEEEENTATGKGWGAGAHAGPVNRRLLKDYQNLMRQDLDALGFSLQPLSDDRMDLWKVHLFNFEDCPLVADLERLKREQNKDYVEMEMTFQPDYPFSPPFIRVVYPRFQFHTGHVTVSGSICFQLLTPSGWLPSNDIEAILIQIRSNMIAGDARIDFSNRTPYSQAEARADFQRVASQHGWL